MSANSQDHYSPSGYNEVSPDNGIERSMARCNITREQAISTLRYWWSGMLMAYGLNRQARITECRLEYVPFWTLRAKVTGRIQGYIQGEEEEVKRDFVIDEAYVWTGIARDPGESGVEYLRDPDVDAMQYDPHIKPAMDPTVPLKNAMANGKSAMEYEALKGIDVTRITSKVVKVVPARIGLIYYPLWIIRYEYLGKHYPVTVDGVAGRIWAGKAPGDMRLRSFILGASILTVIFGIMISAWALVNSPSANTGFLAMIILAICLFAMFKAFELYESDPDITLGEFGGKFRGGASLRDPNISVDMGPVRIDDTYRASSAR